MFRLLAVSNLRDRIYHPLMYYIAKRCLFDNLYKEWNLGVIYLAFVTKVQVSFPKNILLGIQ